MKALIAFWKKDIINKLIVLVSLAILGGVAGVGYIALSMPQGRSFLEAFNDFLPAGATPTFDISVYLTPNTATPSPYTATPRPTIAIPLTETPTLATTEQASPTVEAPATLASAETPLPASPTAGAPSLTSGPAQAGRPACIPVNAGKTANIVEVVDGNTVRALLDGFVYTVRYIGVGSVTDQRFVDAARIKNRELVYGRQVTLIGDIAMKDDRGRLLYYVLAGDVFVNEAIIAAGYGLATDTPPNSSCAAVFSAAQQKAIDAALGQWSLPTPTPRP
jgi:endonuclease YncB( thermonuclease family)